ncbi:MAG TPA: hypothetical protein VGP47_06960, partial [Parachlamydiaceae bacterium]|nr:hypothetical protein [Parachlamydiaceae bacterium]
AIGALTTSMMFIYAPIKAPLIIECLLFFFGVFSAGFLPSFSIAKELCSKHYVATGLGFMNMFNMIGIALSQPFVGYILDRLWGGEIVNNVRIYSLEAYHIGLAILPIGMVLALLTLPFMHETYCKAVEE